jgi:hypothetical protein
VRFQHDGRSRRVAAIAGRRSARWLHAFLHSSHVGMPDFEFERDAADNLVAYIVSLKRR